MGHQRVFGLAISSARQRAVFRFGSVALAVLLALSWFAAGPALAQSISISATSGAPGASITVSGSGFVNGDTYQITFAPATTYEQPLTPTTVISGTSFSRAVTIPAAPWGNYIIAVTTSRGPFRRTSR